MITDDIVFSQYARGGSNEAVTENMGNVFYWVFFFYAIRNRDYLVVNG